MKNITIHFILLVFVFTLLSGCEKDTEYPVDATRTLVHPPINPNEQPDELNNALIVFGELQTGSLPSPVNPANVNITVTVSTASITSGNILFLPLGFSSIDCLKGLYLQVNGADHYWDIPVTLTNAEDNSVVVGITVPFFVQQGSFQVSYMLYDCDGNIGVPQTMFVSIVPSENRCGSGLGFSRVSGSDGITVRTYDLGDIADSITISYNMFTLKDRMDIRYNDRWVESTAPVLLEEGQAPPIKPCNEVTGVDGFVSNEGRFKIYYDPSISRELSIYVSGCLNEGTEWYFDVDCPGDNDTGIQSSVCNNFTAQTTYDKNDPDYHFYPTEGNDLMTIICDTETDPDCTVSKVFNTLLQKSKFIAPTNDTMPVVDCKVTWVNILLSSTNPIISNINYTNRSVSNYTLENYPDKYGFNRTHMLHPGKVVRSVREVDGKVVIVTEGEGTGKLGGVNENPYVSGYVWGEVDKELKEYWEDK